MEATQEFTIGSEVSCTDGVCGELSRVVVDPVAQVLTHLVVEPQHRRGLARLVPLDLVDTTPDHVQLRCTTEQFDKLEPAEETDFLPGAGGYGTYGSGQAYMWPYYGLGGGMGMGGLGMGNATQAVTRDTVPEGEIAIHRNEPVHASDGDVGKVQGLVIDPSNHHVTHVLLQEGHLWGRKDVAIPIASVSRVAGSSGITVSMTKDEIAELPAVELDAPST